MKTQTARTIAPVPAPTEEDQRAWLGPGLITGASDDDPSGIGTYAQAGAQFGTGMLWVMLFTYPLMAAFQELDPASSCLGEPIANRPPAPRRTRRSRRGAAGGDSRRGPRGS